MLPVNYEKIHGWCTLEKANKMIDLVNLCKPSLVVELGVFGGRSLLALALACKYNNKNSKVIGVDAWTSEASLEGTNSKENDEWWANINYADMQNYTETVMKENEVNDIVELWKAKSADVINQFADNSIDILHQDSNHSEEVSVKEVEIYSPKLKTGGYWIFDDINWDTTKKAQDLLVSKGFVEIYVDSKNEWKIYRKN
jgi:predicted O-methyltransferase YrrM